LSSSHLFQELIECLGNKRVAHSDVDVKVHLDTFVVVVVVVVVVIMIGKVGETELALEGIYVMAFDAVGRHNEICWVGMNT